MTHDLPFTLLDSPAESDVLEIRQKLREFNAPHWEVREKQQQVLRVQAGTELAAGETDRGPGP